MSTYSVFVIALLLVLAALLAEVLKWLKLIGDSLGCNKYRTKHIAEMMKKLGHDRPGGESKLSKDEYKELDETLKETFDAELAGGPARAWQLIKLTEQMTTLIKLLEARLEPPAPR